MKNWLKKKLRDWLFEDERPNTIEHRVINVPAEIITLRSRHQVSSQQLDEMIRAGRLTKETAIQLIQTEAAHNLLEQIRKGGFLETTHFTNSHLAELGTMENIELKLMVVKPKY
jgi:hypothetical protein